MFNSKKYQIIGYIEALKEEYKTNFSLVAEIQALREINEIQRKEIYLLKEQSAYYQNRLYQKERR